MAVTKITLARFVVTGESLTGRSRELMCEGDWKKALTVLTDGLEGVSYEQAISILEGEYRLEGEGGNILMVKESPEAARALQDQYLGEYGLGGFVKRNNRMYQAYLVIDNLGWKDTMKARTLDELKTLLCPDWMDDNQTVHLKASRRALFPLYSLELRGMFYAQRPDTDFACLVKNNKDRWVLVLFEETTEGTTPFWREKENTNPQAAYDQVAQYLPVSGFAQRYGEPHPDMVPQAYVAPVPSQIKAEPANEDPEGPTEAERRAAKKAECERLRKEIISFADKDTEFGWHTYVWKSDTPGMPVLTLRAPKRALLCYALSPTTAFHLAPEYGSFSPQGLKMYEDNPYHTDVWLGCGFDIDDMTYDHNNPHHVAVLDMMFEIQKATLGFEVQVLARGKQMTGNVVYHDSSIIDENSILVIPHAGVDFELQALKAGAVICEVGGKLAHLVTVCREMRKPILRMDNAIAKLKRGQKITITPAEGRVEIHPSRLAVF